MKNIESVGPLFSSVHPPLAMHFTSASLSFHICKREMLLPRTQGCNQGQMWPRTGDCSLPPPCVWETWEGERLEGSAEARLLFG